MTKDVDSMEVVIGPVLELEAQKVAVVRKRAAAQLNDEGRGKVSCKHTGQCLEYKRIVVTRTNAFEGGVTLDHLGLREERNERLVGGRLDEELQGVAIVSDPLQRANDRLHNCASSDYDKTVRYCYRQKKELD